VNHEEITQAATFIADATGFPSHDAGLVLGSGLGDYAASLPDAIVVPYADIPEFPVPQVVGHGGSLISAPVGDGRILILSGRVHTYEGWAMDEVVFGVRTVVASGAKRVMLTNAAGGVNASYSPGDLVIIEDHLNLTGRNPLLGPNDDRLGPRFPDMSTVYTPRLRSELARVFTDVGITPYEGTYAWFLGPTYETPAEVQMAKTMGADLVGMSTVPEAIAARHMGAEVAGISLVTNLAAGISATPLSHDDVTETAAKAKETFTAVLDAYLPTFVSGSGV
jgi:purine-nucleoside phosphorylase